MPNQTATKAPAARLDCPTCGKNFANQKNLTTHVDKTHKEKPNPEPAVETNDADQPLANPDEDNDPALAAFVQTEDELQAENEMMVEFAKQLDILEEIKNMTQNDIVYEENNDLKKVLRSSS